MFITSFSNKKTIFKCAINDSLFINNNYLLQVFCSGNFTKYNDIQFIIGQSFEFIMCCSSLMISGRDGTCAIFSSISNESSEVNSDGK